MPKSGLAGSYGNSVFSFVRSLHSVFYSGCTNLYSVAFLNSRIFQDSYLSSEKMSVEYEGKRVKLGARWQMGQKGQWPGVEIYVCSFSERQYCIRRLRGSGAEETSVQIPPDAT